MIKKNKKRVNPDRLRAAGGAGGFNMFKVYSSCFSAIVKNVEEAKAKAFLFSRKCGRASVFVDGVRKFEAVRGMVILNRF